jgi:SAM-dependent methyltransferase
MMAAAKTLPRGTVRGEIRHWILQHAWELGDNVLEVGSRIHIPGAWWCSNRDLAKGFWHGIDMQPGAGVDQVVDVQALPNEWTDKFSGVLCSEVLEHVRRPDAALREILRVLQPAGVAVFTTLTAFPLHGYPNDYRRWTEAGLRADLEDAGFDLIMTSAAGVVRFTLNDHGAGSVVKTCPQHVFAIASKPC